MGLALLVPAFAFLGRDFESLRLGFAALLQTEPCDIDQFVLAVLIVARACFAYLQFRPLARTAEALLISSRIGSVSQCILGASFGKFDGSKFTVGFVVNAVLQVELVVAFEQIGRTLVGWRAVALT